MTALATLKNSLPDLCALMKLNAQDGVDIQTMALQELDHLNAHALMNQNLLDCDPQSVLLAVKSSIKKNLTLDPSAGLMYVKTRNVKRGNDWVKVMEIQLTCNGLISFYRQIGRIFDIKRPEVFKNGTGKVTEVFMEVLVPTFDPLTMKQKLEWRKMSFDESDFMRWRKASHKENSRNKNDASEEKLNYANPNYTNFNGGIDPEFSRAKCIIHGLKKMGANQNEVNAKRVSSAPFQPIVIDQEAELAAMQEEQRPAETFQDAHVIESKATPTKAKELDTSDL